MAADQQIESLSSQGTFSSSPASRNSWSTGVLQNSGMVAGMESVYESYCAVGPADDDYNACCSDANCHHSSAAAVRAPGFAGNVSRARARSSEKAPS